MSRFKLCLLVVSSALMVACATTQPESTPAEPQAAAEKPAPVSSETVVANNDVGVTTDDGADPAERVIICKKEAITGSRMKRTVCRSYAKGTTLENMKDINTRDHMRGMADTQRPKEF